MISLIHLECQWIEILVHHIELLPNAEPHYRCQYRMSAAELAEVRR